MSARVVDQLIAVMLAIDLDHQPGLQAGEVGEVRAERELARELVVQQLPAAEAAPEPAFGPRHLLSQLPCLAVARCPKQSDPALHAAAVSSLRGDCKSGR
jgi:hypothetical protein